MGPRKKKPKPNAASSSSAARSELCRREIALEGLEGLTLPSLWIRLREASLYHKKEPLDEATFREEAWANIASDSDLQFFALHEPRDVIPRQEYSRLEDFQDSDLPEYFPSVLSGKRRMDDMELDNDGSAAGIMNQYGPGWEERKEIEPNSLNAYGIYYDKSRPVRGSCRYFSERTDVSQEVRQRPTSWNDIYSEYGDRLVIVASQEARDGVLGLKKLSTKEQNKISPLCYVILEAVARRRHYGAYLVVRGLTILGRGSQILKQVHSYTSALREAGLIKKNKARFDVTLGHAMYQVLTFMFLTGYERPMETEVEKWITSIQKILNDHPYGYPGVLMPRLEGFLTKSEKDTRKRIRRILPTMVYENILTETALQQFPALSGHAAAESKHIVLYLFGNSEDTGETRDEKDDDADPLVIPADLGIVSSPKMQSSMVLAGLKVLKANRERGISEPELQKALHTVCTRKQAENSMRRMLAMGYAVHAGRFSSRSKPKRYVLVANEEERQRLLESRTESPARPSRETQALGSSVVPAGAVSTAEKSLATRRLESVAEKMQCFVDGNFFSVFAPYFDSALREMALGDACSWMEAAVEDGLLTAHIVCCDSKILQAQSESLEASQEQSPLFIHASADSTKILEQHRERMVFKQILLSALAPTKETKNRLSYGSSYFDQVSCHESFSQERIIRLRVLHRYVFHLAYGDEEKALPRPAWAKFIQPTKFCGTLRGWITLDEIIRQMPLAVFVRIVPEDLAQDDSNRVITLSADYEPTKFLPLYKQNLRVLCHIARGRHFIYVMRSLLFDLRCMGLLAEGHTDGFYPERTGVYFVYTSLNVKNTSLVQFSDFQEKKKILKPHVAAALGELRLDIKSDQDVCSMWKELGEQAVRLPTKGTRVKEKKRKTKENNNRVIDLKERLGDLLRPLYPHELPENPIALGDNLSVMGFDTKMNFHERTTWFKVAKSILRLKLNAGYVPDLDDYDFVIPSAMTFTVPIKEDAEYRRKKWKPGLSKVEKKAAAASVITIKTNGKAMKPGPKRRSIDLSVAALGEPDEVAPSTSRLKKPLRGSKMEISKLFMPSNYGVLFRDARPWTRAEELVAKVYIVVRDMITGIHKRYLHAPLLQEILNYTFPNAKFKRSLLECEVFVYQMYRKQRTVHDLKLLTSLIRNRPQFELPRFFDRFRSDLPRNFYSQKAVLQAWRNMIITCLDSILRSREDIHQLLLETFSIKSYITDKEVAEQFMLENLAMQAILSKATLSPQVLKTMNCHSDRILIGMATHLNSRGIMASRKAFGQNGRNLLITVGKRTMGLSTKYCKAMSDCKETVLGQAAKIDQYGAFVENEADPRIVVPHSVLPILRHYAFYHDVPLHALDQLVFALASWEGLPQRLPKVVGNLAPLEQEASSFFRYLHLFGLGSKVEHAAGDLNRVKLGSYRILHALPAFVHLINVLRNELELVYTPWLAKYTAGLRLTSTEEAVTANLEEHLPHNGVDVAVCRGILKAVLKSKAEGIAKADLWGDMEQMRSLDLAQADQALQCLVDLKCAVPVGIDSILYVASCYASRWIYEAPGIIFQTRPWLKLDGSLSTEVFVVFLRWVLQTVCHYSRISIEELATAFHPYMMTRNTLDVLQILYDLGFIRKFRRRPGRPPTYLEITAENSWLDDETMSSIFVECRHSPWESLMKLSALEELTGYQPETTLPDVPFSPETDSRGTEAVLDELSAVSAQFIEDAPAPVETEDEAEQANQMEDESSIVEEDDDASQTIDDKWVSGESSSDEEDLPDTSNDEDWSD